MQRAARSSTWSKKVAAPEEAVPSGDVLQEGRVHVDSPVILDDAEEDIYIEPVDDAHWCALASHHGVTEVSEVTVTSPQKGLRKKSIRFDLNAATLQEGIENVLPPFGFVESPDSPGGCKRKTSRHFDMCERHNSLKQQKRIGRVAQGAC